MQINYDPQVDAIYIRLREGEVDNTVQVGKYIYADVDEHEVPLGLEILFASRVIADNELTSISFNVSTIVSATPVLTPSLNRSVTANEPVPFNVSPNSTAGCKSMGSFRVLGWMLMRLSPRFLQRLRQKHHNMWYNTAERMPITL